jgi:hypothetical protein
MLLLAPDAVAEATTALTKLHLEAGRRLLAFHRAQGHKEFGCNDVQQYGVCKHDVPASETRAMVQVAEMLETLPALRKAAEDGELSWWQLRLLTPYATPESDEACVLLAREFTVDQLAKALRDVAGCLNKRKSRETIVCWKLDVQTLAMLEHALRKLSEQSGRRLSTNEGLQHMSALVLTGKTDEASLQHCREHADLDILADEARRRATLEDLPDEITDDVPEIKLEKVADLPPWQNSRLRLNPHRHGLTPAQRLEIKRRDGYCCATPGCRNTCWLEVHHIVYYYKGGRTVYGNLVVLCSACHRLIHLGWLLLCGEAPDGLEFRDRHGRLLRERPPDG